MERDVVGSHALFWEKVDKSGGPDACWPWTRQTDRVGYGMVKGVGRMTFRSHRVAYKIVNGSIPKGMYVLHRCDNPPCCNPAHLWIGTLSENMRDMVAKGRNSSVVRPERVLRGAAWHAVERHYRHGEEMHNSVLRRADVDRIIARYAAGGETQRQIAESYGISGGHVSKIVTGHAWVSNGGPGKRKKQRRAS